MKCTLSPAVVAAIAIVPGSCNRIPWFSAPRQSPTFEQAQIRAARVVELAEPEADLRIARDIESLGASPWRWSQQRPAVKVKVRSNENLSYTIDFALAEVTFKDTGPVTITFTVNDHVLDRVRYDESGVKHFEKPVPADWLPNDEYAIVGANLDKLWKSPVDGKTFGIILVRMGLKQ